MSLTETDATQPVSQDPARDMLDALRRIAFFPDAPAHRDLSFSQAVWRMQAIAAEALAAAEGR